tara:strand:- start:1531 stop:1773 length:243 start_codon:yes stop_codon:yes gene_type:complete
MPGKWDGKSRISNDLYRKRHEEIFGKKKMKKAKKIKLDNGKTKPINVKVGYKDAPKIFVDPKKVKVTTSIIRFPFEKENQ